LGIPARLATGYAQGEFDPETDSYFVSELDAHAWPEVFFPSYGWVEFEPTTSQAALLRPGEETGPGQPGPSAGDTNTAGGGALDSAGLPVVPGSGPGDAPSGQDVTLAGRGVWPWILALALGLAGALFLIRSRSLGLYESEADGTVGRLQSLRWWSATPARRAYGSMIRWGRWLGISLGPSGTPLEQAEALARLLPESGAAAHTIAEAYASERYGSHAVDPIIVRQAWLGLRWQLARASLRSVLRPFARRVASASRSAPGPQRRPPS